jgi:hypothetical protein
MPHIRISEHYYGKRYKSLSKEAIEVITSGNQVPAKLAESKEKKGSPTEWAGLPLNFVRHGNLP